MMNVTENKIKNATNVKFAYDVLNFHDLISSLPASKFNNKTNSSSSNINHQNVLINLKFLQCLLRNFHTYIPKLRNDSMYINYKIRYGLVKSTNIPIDGNNNEDKLITQEMKERIKFFNFFSDMKLKSSMHLIILKLMVISIFVIMYGCMILIRIRYLMYFSIR